MTWSLTPEEKRLLLAELDRANRARKSEIMARYEVDRREVHKWRKALAEGTLGGKRGRRKNPDLEREIGRLVGLPQVLAGMIKADPTLATDPCVPGPPTLRKAILDGIVDRVDDEQLPWHGHDGPDWVERLEGDLHSRESRLRTAERKADEKNRFEPGDIDFLRELPEHSPEELCRRADCPCTRLCRAQHIHPTAAGSRRAPGSIAWEQLPPAWHVCQSPRCAINRYCCSPIFGGPLHVHRPKAAVAPRATPAKPLAEWSAIEDCPWRDRCDAQHERPSDSEMEIWNVVQATWQPILLWCTDPECRSHRRGSPHIHCRGCGAAWPAHARCREIDIAAMTRDHTEIATGLCEACCVKWKQGAAAPPRGRAGS